MKVGYQSPTDELTKPTTKWTIPPRKIHMNISKFTEIIHINFVDRLTFVFSD